MKTNCIKNILSGLFLVATGLVGDITIYFSSVSKHDWPLYNTFIVIFGGIIVLAGVITIVINIVKLLENEK